MGPIGSKLAGAFLPFLAWFEEYTPGKLRLDIIGGVTVALVLVPQSMAYAQLAGLPAYYGLYAAFLPPLIAALFGSSRQLATGPVAVVSLMTATALEPLATAGSSAFIAYAILLALIVGVFQFLLGILRLGLVVNFLSHPVVNGFTNAAAIIIATSQLSKLFGVKVESGDHHYETVYNVIDAAVAHTHWPTLGLAALAFLIMIVLRRVNPRIPYVLVAVIVTTLIAWTTHFDRKYTANIADIKAQQVRAVVHDFNQGITELQQSAERRVALSTELAEIRQAKGTRCPEAIQTRNQLELVGISLADSEELLSECRKKLRRYRFTAVVQPDSSYEFYPAGKLHPDAETAGDEWRLLVGNSRLNPDSLKMSGGGDVVGVIPEGLPSLTIPDIPFRTALNLLPMAMIISLLGFMEAISIAKAMAAKTGQRLDPNQELIGQGLANVVGSVAQSYPVSGSFSRSAVNLQAGAVTGLSSVVSSIVVLITLLFLTPLLYHLPQSVLAAIIMMAVAGLLNVKTFVQTWRAQWYDGIIGLITFVATLLFAPHLDRGIMIGVALSLLLYLLRNMKPELAMLSLHTDGTFRNRQRFDLEQCRYIAVIRYAGSLFFANVNYLEDKVVETVRSMPELRHVLIVGNAINELDASGEEALATIIDRLHARNVEVSMSGLNDSVLDTMRRTGLLARVGEDHIFRNATRAIQAIWPKAHRQSGEQHCPLREVSIKRFPVAPSLRVRKDLGSPPDAEPGSPPQK